MSLINSKNIKRLMLLIISLLTAMLSNIASNVFGLCVSLPLHKCSNYRQKLIGQIAQNPC